MEEFFKLRADKQHHIINGAFTVFSQNTYKKAAVSDIAAAAGISKAMVFYYFGGKKALYLYLVRQCGGILTEEKKKHFDKDVTDFFDRIKMITLLKMSVIVRQPALLPFLKNVYFETDPEVVDDIREIISTGMTNVWSMMLDEADISRFEDENAPELLMKLLIWSGEGVVSDWYANSDLQVRIDEYIQCLDLLKKVFYIKN